MTGNKNAWRAPLAGLASVAMIATMGVTALSANAAETDVVRVTTSHGVNVNGTDVWSTSGRVDVNLAKGSSLTIKDAGDADGFAPTGDGVLTGSKGESYDVKTFKGQGAWTLDFTPAFTEVARVSFDGGASYVDAASDNTVTVPSGSQWYEYNGYLYKPSATVRLDTIGDVTLTKVDVAKGYVQFNALGGKFTNDESVAYQKIDGNGKVSLPANPTKDNSTFGGWQLPTQANGAPLGWTADKDDLTYGEDGKVYAENIDDVTFTGSNITVNAYWIDLSKKTVRFHYGSYANAPKDEYVKTAPNEAIAVPSEKPVREGYLFKGWAKADGTVYNASTTLAGDFFDFDSAASAFTLNAVWKKADALEALRYVVAVDNTKAGVSGAKENAAAFTSASWDEYTTVYKKALNEYNAAEWDAWNGSMKAETAKSIVDQLQAGWKQLRFNNGVTDTTIDGKTNKDAKGAEMVYRLATPDGQRHFMTADENEVLARTNMIFSLNGWKLESASSFRMVNNKWAVAKGMAGDQGKVSQDLGYEIDGDDTIDVTLPLVKTVTRLYNSVSQEHLYTTSPAEVANLTKGDTDWSVDSSNSYLYTPALYDTNTEVARFYNPATGLHFYTTDKAEINFWTVQHPGIWTKETTGIYAL